MTPRIQIFADTADPIYIRKLAGDARVSGFTTNPTLFRVAGAEHYLEHARAILDAACGKPVSLEVIADGREEMARQARVLAALGSQVVVKIPVMTTRGEMLHNLVAHLRQEGVQINVTAVFTSDQVHALAAALAGYTQPPTHIIVSIFAGRIADAGADACQAVRDCCTVLRRHALGSRILWASSRQVYDVMLAERAGCDIITLTPELLSKVHRFGRDLGEFSRETVEMFYRDATAAGYVL